MLANMSSNNFASHRSERKFYRPAHKFSMEYVKFIETLNDDKHPTFKFIYKVDSKIPSQ